MKLPADPKLPIFGGADYARSLYQRLYALFRQISAAVNANDNVIAQMQPTLDQLTRTPPGLRNKVINGDMRIGQRGTSFANANGYTLDRWAVGASGAAVTASQIGPSMPDVPFNMLRLTVTAADVAPGGGDYLFITQPIEGYNVLDLVGVDFTISFDVRTSKPGTYCLALRNGGLDRAYLATFTVDVADTLEHKVITVPGGLITAGTWNWANYRGIELMVCLMSGVGFVGGAPDTWLTGNFFSLAGQTNFADSVGATFDLGNVALVASSVDTPFESRPAGLEQSLCERYFEYQSFTGLCGVTYTANGDTRAYLPFRTVKRVVPALSTSSVLSVIATGRSGDATNVSLGTLTMTATTTHARVSSISNHAAFSGCGAIMTWGSASTLIFGADAEL